MLVHLVLVQHVESNSQFTFLVVNDGVRKLQLGNSRIALDVRDPRFVRGHIVAGQRDRLYIACREFRQELDHLSEFRGADRGEIGGMRKQNRPPVDIEKVSILKGSVNELLQHLLVPHPLVQIQGSS